MILEIIIAISIFYALVKPTIDFLAYLCEILASEKEQRVWISRAGDKRLTVRLFANVVKLGRRINKPDEEVKAEKQTIGFKM